MILGYAALRMIISTPVTLNKMSTMGDDSSDDSSDEEDYSKHDIVTTSLQTQQVRHGNIIQTEGKHIMDYVLIACVRFQIKVVSYSYTFKVMDGFTVTTVVMIYIKSANITHALKTIADMRCDIKHKKPLNAIHDISSAHKKQAKGGTIVYTDKPDWWFSVICESKKKYEESHKLHEHHDAFDDICEREEANVTKSILASIKDRTVDFRNLQI